MCVVTHYTEEDGVAPKEVTLDFGREGNFEVYLLDANHDGELTEVTDRTTFTLPCHSCVLLREI